VLPKVQSPGQYVGGELNSVVKDRRSVRGALCLAFPDAYSIGMSHHGLQLLYHLMNLRDDWACERAFAPGVDAEHQLRENGLPLFSLETYTPMGQFDVVGFTLQHELGYSNVLTMLDMAGIPLAADSRTREHPLVIAGGPSTTNPEPMSRFIDLFVIGDGEEALPQVCDAWIESKAGGGDRQSLLVEMARRFPFAYVPSCYEPVFTSDGRQASVRPLFPGVPERIEPAVVADLDAVPLPTSPIVPFVECVQDRIAIEVMRGCPWHCRFCQSTTTKRPLRFRKVETIVNAALESYRTTGSNEISLLSLSTSDYPHFDELMRRMQETFRPLGVAVSVPSLRINEELRTIGDLLNTDRHSSLTIAPEAASDAMRKRIGKNITNDDLREGCRLAFSNGFNRVKLYFMCGLPGEQQEDLEGILELSDAISRIGKDVTGRFATVVANVSNFVPKPQTPFQWNAMQTREYFRQAHSQLFRNRRFRTTELKCHDIEGSMLEGALARGDRRMGPAIEAAWRRGARFDSWSDRFQPQLWWDALAECQIDLDRLVHQSLPIETTLPWDHIGIRQGRGYLEKEHLCAIDS
jgi:radical SAM family uncharacterized protein